MLEEARHYGEMVAQKATPYTEWKNGPDTDQTDRPLRVGMVSGDLRNHPVGFFIEGMLASLTSNPACRLELTAYSTVPASDALTERLKTNFRHWHMVDGIPDDILARLFAGYPIEPRHRPSPRHVFETPAARPIS